MTKIEEIEQKLNELKANFNAEFYDLQHELAELKESKKEGKWKPEYNEVYWFRDISNDGEVEQCKWYGEGMDIWRCNNIPIFKTEKECERYWHFMDTVKEKSYEFTADEWEDGGVEKLYISYSYSSDNFYIDDTWYDRELGAIYFKEKTDAQYIIDNFKDELMEFFL